MRISTKIVLMLVSLLALTATVVLAADNVTNSKHNFGYGGSPNRGTQYTGEIQEVCKYCHTPHNAEPGNFLWNKSNKSGTTYRMYTSSRTLTRATITSSFTADSPSLLCLGCHDGKTAMNVLHSASTDGPAAPVGYSAGSKMIGNGNPIDASFYYEVAIQDGPGGFGIDPTGVNLGKAGDGTNATQGDDLTNDHPVGMSYTAVYAERSAGLYDLATVKSNSSNKIRFFGTTNRLECSSCHNPHADGDDLTVKPFLAMNNDGSALCLSCHNK